MTITRPFGRGSEGPRQTATKSSGEAVDAKFWIEKWEQQQIGFHLPTAHPMLARHWSALDVDRDAHVFVPLCGKSLDLIYLMSQGCHVTGVELSPIAIRQFLDEQGLQAATMEIEGVPVSTVDGLWLIEGDFFRLSSQVIGRVDAVYDRAALIAMPPDQQERYAQQLLALTPISAPILLVTLDYDPSEMSGPPFATPADQVRRLFEGRYEVDLLEQVDALVDNLALQGRGLTGLTETAWRLRPRQASAEADILI
jgi:thiopurine S-methyltransferase